MWRGARRKEGEKIERLWVRHLGIDPANPSPPGRVRMESILKGKTENSPALLSIINHISRKRKPGKTSNRSSMNSLSRMRRKQAHRKARSVLFRDWSIFDLAG